MSHLKFALMLSEYVDGRLDEAQELVLKDHIKKCNRCSTQLGVFEKLQVKTERNQSLKVSPYFVQRVLAEYDHRRGAKIWQVFEHIPRRLAITGMALSLILFGLAVSPKLQKPADTLESQYSLLFNQGSDLDTVTDDEALVIALTAESLALNGE